MIVSTRLLACRVAFLCLVLALATVATLVAPSSAMAGHEEKIELKFLGFGTNPDFYGVVQKDKVAGDTLMVYQVGMPAPGASLFLEGISVKKALKSPAFSGYGIGVVGVNGPTAAQGYTLVGQAVGVQFQVGLTNGTDQVTLGYAPVASDPTGGELAVVSIKSVHWTQDGARVVVILHQKLSGDWPMDSDSLVAFALAPAPPAE